MIKDPRYPFPIYEQPRTQPRRVSLDATLLDVITLMAEGNPGAVDCLLRLVDHDKAATIVKYLYVLDEYEIYGYRIYMLYNDCCNRDILSLCDLLDAFGAGCYTKQEIRENLNRLRALPFQPHGGESHAATD